LRWLRALKAVASFARKNIKKYSYIYEWEVLEGRVNEEGEEKAGELRVRKL